MPKKRSTRTIADVKEALRQQMSSQSHRASKMEKPQPPNPVEPETLDVNWNSFTLQEKAEYDALKTVQEKNAWVTAKLQEKAEAKAQADADEAKFQEIEKAQKAQAQKDEAKAQAQKDEAKAQAQAPKKDEPKKE